MPHIDIASLLREALVISGCTQQQIGEFDGHSTITLELTGLPALNIGVVGEGVWFWSELVACTDNLLIHRSEGLLRFLMQGCEFALTEQMQLVNNDGQLEVRVMLARSAFADAHSLASAVDGYLTLLAALCELVR